jgi:integrase/recombinase XerD
MDLEKRFAEFLQAGLYLRGWSHKTPVIYRRAFASFQQSLGSEPVQGPIAKAQLEAWIVSRRQAGMSPAGVNIYIRAMNAFCSWLKENGYVAEHIVLRQLKNQPKPVTVFSEAEIRALLTHKPKRLSYLRTWTMIVLMLDTGCRIDEVLNLKKSDVDFDNLLLTVNGKGSKIRRVPLSVEGRKHLWTYCQKSQTDYVFGTRTGTRITYRNAYRGIKHCFAALGVVGSHVHPHNLRHSFACHYIKKGGSVVALSRILGHSSISTTQGYLRGLQVEDFENRSSYSLLVKA